MNKPNIGDLFRFKKESLNTTQNWMVTDVKEHAEHTIIYYIPEFTPVANNHMYRFESLEVIKIDRIPVTDNDPEERHWKDLATYNERHSDDGDFD